MGLLRLLGLGLPRLGTLTVLLALTSSLFAKSLLFLVSSLLGVLV